MTLLWLQKKNAGLPNGAEQFQINGFLHYKANVISLSTLTSGIRLGRESCLSLIFVYLRTVFS